MKVVIIILVILLIAAVVVISNQKERNGALKDYVNLSLSKIKDLEKENSALRSQIEKLVAEGAPDDNKGKEFQGHH